VPVGTALCAASHLFRSAIDDGEGCTPDMVWEGMGALKFLISCTKNVLNGGFHQEAFYLQKGFE
jgi:hypothetical protein